MNRIGKAVVSILALGAFAAAFAGSSPQWHNLYPRYNGLATDGTQFVAVSEDGVIRVGDGNTWPTQFLRNLPLRAVAYGGGQFLVAPHESQMIIADNPTNESSWQPIPGSWAFGANYQHMIFVGAASEHADYRFVAVGGDEQGYPQYFRLDGEDWEELPGPLNITGTATHIAFGNAIGPDTIGRFAVAANNNIHTLGEFDEQHTFRLEPNVIANVVAFGEGYGFVALGPGSVAKSPDGTQGSWTSANNAAIPQGLRDLYYAGNGVFVAVGDAGVGVVSTDGGNTWTEANGLSQRDNFVAVRTNTARNLYIAVGENGSIYTSANGSAWTMQVEGRVMTYNAFAAGGGVYVAVGDSGISYSSDGKSWHRAANDANARNLRAVTYGVDRYGESKFIAVGPDGWIVYSADGNTWHRAGGNITNRDNLVAVTALSTMQPVMVGGQMQIIEVSTFVAGGSNDAGRLILTSEDGEEWEEKSGLPAQGDWTNANQHILSLAGGNGVVLAGSTSGVVMSTTMPTEATDWQRVTTPPANSGDVVSLTYSNGMFVGLTIAGRGGSETAMTMSSPSGASNTWTSHGHPQPRLNYVTAGKDYIVAVADGGRMFAMPISNISGGWTSVTPGNVLPRATTGHLRTVFFDDTTGVFLAGGSNVILYSDVNPAPSVSVRNPATTARANRSAGRLMRMERGRGAPVISFVNAPERAGTVAVYSLNGRQLYRTQVAAGQRSVQLPSRMVGNSAVIVRFVGADGATVSQRFTMVR